MKTSLPQQLKDGMKIKIKHPNYAFIIHAELKIEEGQNEPAIKLKNINLPTKAGRGEKLLLKLVHIYCFDILCNNLLNDVRESKEYKKVVKKLIKEKEKHYLKEII